MIGQAKLLHDLKCVKAQSVLITGPAHWGKKTLLRELFQTEESVFEINGNAATFRDALERIYSTVRSTVYLIPDIDKMNATVQNLLLKVLEEPPSSARFFLTASKAILPTITSRCVVYRMQPYAETNSELGGISARPAVLGMFKSPGECALIDIEGIENLIQFLTVIRDGLGQGITLANTLKQAKNIHRLIADLNLSQEGLLLILKGVFGDTDALAWLRQQPNDSLRYARTAYFMQEWLGRQMV